MTMSGSTGRLGSWFGVERFGIVPGDVRRAAATLMSGIGVGSLFEEQKVFDVVVWGTPATRASLGRLRDLIDDTHVLDVAALRLVDLDDLPVRRLCLALGLVALVDAVVARAKLEDRAPSGEGACLVRFGRGTASIAKGGKHRHRYQRS